MKMLTILLLFLPGSVISLQQDNQYKEALRLKSEGRLEESLAVFQLLVKSDSSKIEYLNNASFLFSKLGNRLKGEAARQEYFRKAEYLAKKAITTDPKNAEAHYTYALALGRMNEFASSKQKIANGKLIKTACDNAIKINSRHPGAYHILGRWHREIAGFNFVEKGMINTFFGGVPEGGSYDDAIECFSKAVLIQPASLLHKYELALTYYHRGEGDDYLLCKIWCKKILEITPIEQDDIMLWEKAKVLLEKVE